MMFWLRNKSISIAFSYLVVCYKQTVLIFDSALDKLLGQLGTYATWLSSIAYLQKQLRIFIFFHATITPFLIA